MEGRIALGVIKATAARKLHDDGTPFDDAVREAIAEVQKPMQSSAFWFGFQFEIILKGGRLTTPRVVDCDVALRHRRLLLDLKKRDDKPGAFAKHREMLEESKKREGGTGLGEEESDRNALRKCNALRTDDCGPHDHHIGRSR